jgi:hypothetical protein
VRRRLCGPSWFPSAPFSPLYLVYKTASVVQWSELLTTDPGVRFPALPDFLRSSGSGSGSTQPRGDNWGATWLEK